jgi:hypothetical protein
MSVRSGTFSVEEVVAAAEVAREGTNPCTAAFSAAGIWRLTRVRRFGLAHARFLVDP